jgi:citrate synthase
MTNMKKQPPSTGLCKHGENAIWYRDRDLVGELIGRRSFTDVLFEHNLGREPQPAQVRMVDAILVTLMEHGFTPSAISARLIYMSSPENLQSGVAAGLLGIGSQFIGTMEDCAKLLALLTHAPEPTESVHALALRYRAERRPVPGFGHHLHPSDDPRATRLLELANDLKLADAGVNTLRQLAAAVDQAAGRHIPINATGAVAAVLHDLKVPVGAMRGFAIIARAAGLVAHLVEEQSRPTGRFIWDLVDRAIPYDSLDR